jgi:2-polyprenyl-3-methyl-5-hydroxy-6-metoxy-1,4-benzoquinol methylase
MVDLDLAESEVAEVRRALAQLAAEEPERFSALFDPARAAQVVPLPAALVEPLLRVGLISETPGGHQVGQRLRTRGSRHYLMSTGASEYRQDIWPETDSLLEVLESATPGRLLDMGTGTGIVAVEAAARGHQVVATDLYENTLKVARFNARLNDIDGIEFRQGHLFQPARGEKFDLILTAPHYTRIADQLRLESLQSGLELVADGGRLVIATFFEWEGGDDAPIPIVETVLRPMVERGASVTVKPIVSALKKGWFTRAESETPLAGLVSRHRFVVVLEPSGGRLSLERPRPREQLTEVFVPLARLTFAGDRSDSPRGKAVLDDAPDVSRLEELLVALAGGMVALSGAIPLGLHDSCRFAAAPCVSLESVDGAAGAILDLSGNVRPCTRGGVVGRVGDTMETVLAQERRLFDEAGVRRGCDTCVARTWCARCLFTGPLSEHHYCAIQRAAGPELPLFNRLMALCGTVDARTHRLQAKLRRVPTLLVARSRQPGDSAPHHDDGVAAGIATRLRRLQCWIVVLSDSRSADSRFALSMLQEGNLWLEEVDRQTAALAELILDGAGGSQLERWAAGEQLASDELWSRLQQLAGV